MLSIKSTLAAVVWCPHAASAALSKFPLRAVSLAQENIDFYRLFPEQKPAGKAEMAFAAGFCYTEQFKLSQDLAAVFVPICRYPRNRTGRFWCGLPTF